VRGQPAHLVRERNVRRHREHAASDEASVSDHGPPGAVMAVGSIWIANDDTPSDFTTSSTQTTRPCDTDLSPEITAWVLGSLATASRTASFNPCVVVGLPFRYSAPSLVSTTASVVGF